MEFALEVPNKLKPKYFAIKKNLQQNFKTQKCVRERVFDRIFTFFFR